VKGPAVCEKYEISLSRYSVLRFEVTEIRLVKRFSLEEKHRILEEGYQNVIYRVCAAHSHLVGRIGDQQRFWVSVVGFT
jgi:hypothetical protein